MSTDVMTPDNEPAGVKRLRQAREALARLEQLRDASEDAEDAQDEQNGPLKLPQPGTVVHSTRGGLTVHTGGQAGVSGVVVSRGQNIVVTDAMLQATKNKLGEYTGIALAADERAQLRKYGEVRFRVGEAPSDLQPWTYGDADWSVAREAARRQAWAQPTDAERAYALAELERKFGPMASTTTTLNSAAHPSIREAEVQTQRLSDRAAAGQR
jgi:hypothetical protein